MMIYWTTSTTSKYLQFNIFAWRYPWEQRCCHDFGKEFVTLVRTLDDHLVDDANEIVDYEMHDDNFYTWDVQEEENKMEYLSLRKGVKT